MKARIFNAYTGFVLGAVLVGAITFVQLPCPMQACGATGVVKGVRGLEIAGVAAELVDETTFGIECGWDWERYTYDIKISVVNKTATEAWGVIMVDVSDPGEAFTLIQELEDEEVAVPFAGETLQSFPFFIEVPAESARIIEKRIIFEGITLELFSEKMHRIEATTASEFACPFHGEKATVSLPVWLRLIGMR